MNRTFFTLLMLCLYLSSSSEIMGQVNISRQERKPKTQLSGRGQHSRRHNHRNSGRINQHASTSSAVLQISNVESNMTSGVEEVNSNVVTKENESSFQLSENEIKEIIDNIISNMIYVEGGSFMMGANLDDADALIEIEPRHEVAVSSFYIGKYEVTQEEWEAVMGNNPSYHKGRKRPVDQISYYDCLEFIQKLNNMTDKHFRLPSDEEWEYAARGGANSQGFKYSGSDSVDEVGWCMAGNTHRVGLLKPNELGLYDMSGNVSELCSTPYPYEPFKAHYVKRGGEYKLNDFFCRVSLRDNHEPNYKNSGTGLRLVFNE